MKEYYSFCLKLLMLIASFTLLSCSLEKKLAKDFINNRNSVNILVYNTNVFAKINVKIKAIERFDSLSIEMKDSLWKANTVLPSPSSHLQFPFPITVSFTIFTNNHRANIEVGIDNIIPTCPDINPAGRNASTEQMKMSNPPNKRVIPRRKQILPIPIRSSKIFIPAHNPESILHGLDCTLRLFHVLHIKRIPFPPES